MATAMASGKQTSEHQPARHHVDQQRRAGGRGDTAPSRNCPSPPRFQMPARKATIRLAASRSSGAIRVSVSWRPSGDRSPRCRHVAVVVERVDAEREQDDAGEHERRKDRPERHGRRRCRISRTAAWPARRRARRLRRVLPHSSLMPPARPSARRPVGAASSPVATMPTSRPRDMTAMRSAQLEQFVEIGRDQQDRDAGAGGVADALARRKRCSARRGRRSAC